MDNTAIFDQFAKRHIGINESELGKMLEVIGVSSLDQLIDETVPETIRIRREMNLPTALSEYEFLEELKKTAAKNKVFKSYIGLGYHPTITPSVILRNIFQNPGWYTQYTPYQAEISQGRLEALLNFQTTISDLTGLPIANASLLDEGTAAAEAMIMFHSQRNKKNKGASVDRFLVSDQVYPQTLDVLIARAEPLGIEVVSGDWRTFDLDDNVFGILLQYPAANGEICDFRSLTAAAKSKEVYVTVACDLLSLALLTPPGEWGADAAVGNSQRFGVPMGYGGPHAAFFACQEEYKRQIPGRIIGVSVDAHGHRALRMALQTREQHIRREKATSNICTAQALLAIMAGMYAVYHGPEGIRAIAGRIHAFTGILARNLARVGFKPENDSFFDTLSIPVDAATLSQLRELADSKGVNFCYGDDRIGISLNETVNARDLELIFSIFAGAGNRGETFEHQAAGDLSVPESLQRKSGYLTHPVFNQFHSETKMMRYIKRLENKDISLVHSMIPLGSCTMKLNAATELLPVSWSEFADVHPFVPAGQVAGYLQIFSELESYLSEITGFAACSLQPNSGAQGEYAGLLTIRAYHLHNGDTQRNIVLIPSSAHGTNPASAVMAGMEVVVVQCDEKGNIDVEDLRAKAEQNKDRLSALMVTYPSTHGVFETGIKGICQLIHDCGGLVYMDGANMNAQVGLTSPGVIGADVCHLNLHKTFAIPHGGGGPGMGPICVNERLKPFLPGHVFAQTGGGLPIRAVSSAPWGSASILLISYAYIRMLGRKGLLNATRFAILNANYIRARLDGAYSVLYSGEKGRSAHELIIDLRPFKALASAEDVAKRLMDYGFHAPTLSFPVAGTIMVEPTESEDKEELDRFCEAMLQIRVELDEIAKGEADPESNVLSNAPHTSGIVVADQWPYTYSREKAAFPLNYLREGRKFWPSAGRIDGAYGDRNLICTCPPLEDYMATER